MSTIEKYMTELKGLIGMIISIILPMLKDLNTIIQTGGAVLGVILLIASIKNRVLEKKKNQLEIKILEYKITKNNEKTNSNPKELE